MKFFLRLVLSVVLACSTSRAELKVAGIFQDHMVLQREKPLPVWGLADSNVPVTVTANGQTKTVQAGADGRWTAVMDPMKASNEPVPFKVSSGGKEVSFEDVLVGEVWFASGQSNMLMSVKQSLNPEQEIANAAFPRIREFTVLQRNGFAEPRETTEKCGGWTVCSPGKVGEFSAVGYFFARELLQKLDVPVGIIHSAAGGIPAETLTPADALEGHPGLKGLLEARGTGYGPGINSKAELDQAAKDWNDKWEALIADDKMVQAGWAAAVFDDSTWEKAKPETARLLSVPGAVWVRIPFAVPGALAGKAATLGLGQVEGLARVYLNGKEIGGVGGKDGYLTKEAQSVQVPAGLIAETGNLLAVRLAAKRSGRFYAKDGFVISADGQPEKLRLPADGRKVVEVELKPAPPEIFGLPGNLFNGMVAPIVPYQVRGVIWYQGEANADRFAQYRELFPALIQGWRKHWGQPELPFLFVQLANWMPPETTPGDDTWAKLREAQQMASNLPNTGMAVAIDVGEENTIHPRNKQEVGRRLGLIARAKVYGESGLCCSGPVYASKAAEGDCIRIAFDYTGGGLTTRNNEPLKGFSIAPAEGGFQWADAKIDGDSVVVWSDKVKNPVRVRYAWARNPTCNLCNKAGLPAVPFRTDSDPK